MFYNFECAHRYFGQPLSTYYWTAVSPESTCITCGKSVKGELPGPPTESKPTNPKDAVGIAKVPFSVIPANVLGELGIAMMEGARKYGRHNYREAGVRGSVYYDACLRHLMAWWEGEDIDSLSGLSHITKAIAGLVVLRDSMMRGNWSDDRPPRSSEEWMEQLNILAKQLLEKFPESKPAVTWETP